MPIWIYEIPHIYVALILVVIIETIAMTCLFVVRLFVIPRLRYHEGANEAVSGTVQAIGVFYGITVGLIAVGVWNTNSNASDLVSREAMAIATLYRDINGYPSPLKEDLKAKLREYTVFTIEQAWPAQRKGRGQQIDGGRRIMNDFQSRLYTFEPATSGQSALHGETLTAYNRLLDCRRLRIDAVDNGLSTVMWVVIWVGAAISIGIAYFYKLEDARLHVVMVALMGGFLAIVLFMIVINDKPFYGPSSVSTAPYQLVLDRLIDTDR